MDSISKTFLLLKVEIKYAFEINAQIKHMVCVCVINFNLIKKVLINTLNVSV